MLSFQAHLKVFVATAPCDLHASFNGLWAAAQEQRGEDPKRGAVFVLGRPRHNRIKLPHFDGTGVCVLAKRLERGTFHWPQSAGEPNAKLRLAPGKELLRSWRSEPARCSGCMASTRSAFSDSASAQVISLLIMVGLTAVMLCH